MKKIGVILFICLLVTQIVYAQDLYGFSEDVGGQVENFEKKAEQIEEYGDVEKWEEKWDYLAKEWRGILLKNKVVAGLDKFFTQISIVFRILFGMEYSMSLVLLGVVFLWLFIFFEVGRLISSGGVFEGVGAYIPSALLALVLAQVQVLKNIIVLVGRFVFSPSHVWIRFILLIIIIVAFVGIYHASQIYSKFLKHRRESLEKRKVKVAGKGVTKFFEKFRKISSKGE